MTVSKDNPEHEFKPCCWCAIPVSVNLITKRKERKAVDPEACRDCRDNRIDIQRDKKWTHKTLGVIVCNPWPFELDEQWRPITDDGDLYRPGERICGLKDCVRLVHVIPAPVKTVSDTDMILMMHEMQQHNKRAKVQVN
jgi:hypothetical protein